MLCFERKLLEELGVFQGINPDVDKYLPAVTSPSKLVYLNRSEAELDSRYREISAMQQIASGLSQSLDLPTRLENVVDVVLGLTGFDAGCIYLSDEIQGDLARLYRQAAGL